MPPSRVLPRLLGASQLARHVAQRRLPFAATRCASTQPPQTSQHKSFYKTFGRPVAKVVLMAVLTYQIAYLFWTKLEHDELKTEKQEVAELETQVQKLQSPKGP